MTECWANLDEVAAHLGVNLDTIYKWITRRRTPVLKLGGLWNFIELDMDTWGKGDHSAEGQLLPAA